MLPVVAHVHEEFVSLSETFIYQFLTAATRTEPVPIYVRRLNAEHFPWTGRFVQADQPARFSKDRLAAVVKRKAGVDALADQMTGPYERAIRALKPDVVHAHFGPEGVRVAPVCKALNIPLVVSYYGYDLSQHMRSNEWQNAYRRMFASAAAVIALSEDFKRRLIVAGCPEEKIHICRIGVDPTQFAFRPPRKDATGTVQLLGIGRLVEKKGTEFVLRALAEIKDAMPNIRYAHIGDGPLAPQLHALADSLGVSSIVEWCGPRPRAYVQERLAQADIFVLPSVTAQNGDQEGTPVVLYEAMSIGLPILSTVHSGIPEAVTDGENGLLVQERDAPALAAAIGALAATPERWGAMAEFGRNKLVQEFDLRVASKKLEGIYLDVLGRPSIS